MTESMPTALQLKQLREDAKIGVREAARRVEMSVGGYRHYENPKLFKAQFLPLDLAYRFMDIFDAPEHKDAVLRLAGMPEGINPSVEISEHLGSVAAAAGGAVPEMVRVENEEVAPANHDLVPVYSVQASAGPGALVSEEYQTHSLAFPPSYLKTLTSSSPKNLSIISVKGESMEPTLLDNDIVLLDMSKTNLSYDGLFVIRFDEALHVKRVGRSPKRGHITIISDNKELYPPMTAAVEDIEPVGKVLWYGRKV